MLENKNSQQTLLEIQDRSIRAPMAKNGIGFVESLAKREQAGITGIKKKQ